MKTYPGKEFGTRNTLLHKVDFWLIRLSNIIIIFELKMFYKYDKTSKVNVSC